MRRGISRNRILLAVSIVILAMPCAWGILYPLLKHLPKYWAGTIKYTVSLLIGILVYQALPFTIHNKKFYKGLFSYGLLGVICAVMAFLFSFSRPDSMPSLSTVVSYVLYTLAIALSEEYLFRGLLLSAMLESWQQKKGYLWKAIIVCSLVFGVRHLLNLITMPHTVISTIGQVGFTFMAGFYLCAVYLRTRNIWICVFIHFLEDFFTGFWALVSMQAVMQEEVDGMLVNTVMLVIVHSIYVNFGVLMLKDKHYVYQSLIKEE